MKNNTYFQAINQTTTDGQDKAFRAWLRSVQSESSIFEVEDLPWAKDTHDFVETIGAAEITVFAVTDRSTDLMELLHRLADEGCTMQGLCKVTRKEISWSAQGLVNVEREGILFRT